MSGLRGFRRPGSAIRRLLKVAPAPLVSVGSVLVELLRIGREMLRIPAQLWLAIAELAGAGVYSAWRVVARVGLGAYARATAALEWAQAHVRPAYGAIAVAVAAAAVLAASQLIDYRGVNVGAPAYSEVDAVAPAPEVDRARTGAAHGWVGLPLAALALAVVAIAVRGRWAAARLLVPIGLAAIAVGFAVDARKGLDEGEVAIAYQGAEAVLLEGFWAQLAAGAALCVAGPLLAARLRPRADRAARRPRPTVLGSSGRTRASSTPIESQGTNP